MASSPGPTEEGARETAGTVFVSDPSAEAERIAQALRAAGYTVVDVPMSMLIARVAVQRPRVILIDADAEGALDSATRLRELPDAEGIDVVFLGKEGEALKGAEDALAHEGSGFFARPVDIPALVRKIEVLTGGPPEAPGPRASTPPPSLPSPRPSSASLPPASIRAGAERPPSRPPPSGARFPSTAPESLPPSGEAHGGRPAVSIQTPLSTELESLLKEAEERVVLPEAALPSPEEEIEAVLPAEILSSLDEPLDEEDEDDLEALRPAGAAPQPITSTGRGEGAGEPGEAGHATTHGGHVAQPTTGSRTGTSSGAETGPRLDVAPTGLRDTSGPVSLAGVMPEASSVMTDRHGPPTEHGDVQGSVLPGQPAGPTLGSVAPVSGLAQQPTGEDARPTGAPPGLGPSQKAKSVPPPLQVPSVVGPRDGPVVFARAIAMRATGAVCIEAPDGVRRAVLREGDIITAASGVDSESLLAFLGARGDLPREVVQQLSGKVPPFGRHAGAALVAHGHLRQDQLWPVLRTHAEWILGRAMLVARGTALLEAEAPGRLKTEPSVFGGSTGAEVLVEVVRRVIAPAEAIERLGGLAARLGDGPNDALLGECALDLEKRELVTRMRGSTVGEILQAAAEPDFASVLYALSALGVVEAIRAVGSRATAEEPDAREIDALDEEAIRARVRARLELVDEGDYFALLGLSHDATGYEVRRAFLELRRAFEPSRILTPRLADLVDDVRKITDVLEEAYEILHDGARRERYRRAIDASPRP